MSLQHELDELRNRLNELEQQALQTPKKEPTGDKVRNTLVISDLHAPYNRPEALEFCVDLYHKYKCNNVVVIGDEVDNAALSFHPKDPQLPNADTEADRALEVLDGFYKAFPEAAVCIGNHTALPARQASAAGIPPRFLKSYNEVWFAPPGWKWVHQIEFDGVLYTHGVGAGGRTGPINLALSMRKNVVVGHSHTNGGIQWSSNGESQIWAANCGCLIDIDALSMAYAKPNTRKPTLGTIVVLENGRYPVWEPLI